MRITYTGRQVELAPAQRRKIEKQFAKLGKLLDGKDQREAHVILSVERRMQCAEINVNYHNHALVGLGENAEMFLCELGIGDGEETGFRGGLCGGVAKAEDGLGITRSVGVVSAFQLLDA